MKKREPKPATIEVVHKTNLKGATDGKNKQTRTGKGRSRERTARSTILGSLILAGLLVPLAPMPGRADTGGIGSQIAALLAQVESLRSTVSALQGQVSA